MNISHGRVVQASDISRFFLISGFFLPLPKNFLERREAATK